MTQVPPYPADTEPRGWALDLDYEKIEQSDTWALASPEQRPWLLMLWLVAWRQVPSGSLPDDDRLIAARVGMPAAQFTAWRDVLLRGWWRATDGRLYHATLTHHVLRMIDKRRKVAERVTRHRAQGNGHVTRYSGVTNPLVMTPTPTVTTVEQKQKQEHVSAGADTPASPRQNRGTRLPDDWQPEPELVTWTRAEAPAVDVARTLAQFRDYWRAQPGQKGVKTDWPATWRNWIRREAATVRGSGGPRAGPLENLQQRVARKNGLDRLFGGDDGQVGGALGRDGGHLRLALVE